MACGDPYVATNKYDPAFPVQFTIAGPDTLFSLGEAAQYAATTVPAFSDTSFVWETDTVYNYLKYLPPSPPTSPVDDGSLFLLKEGNGAGNYRVHRAAARTERVQYCDRGVGGERGYDPANYHRH